MKNSSLEILPIIFSLVILSFFLPFVNVSCSGQKVATLTGIQLVSGTAVQQPGGFTKAENQEVHPEPMAIVAFVSGVFGLVIAFVRGKPSHVGSAAAGFAGAIALLSLKSKLDNEAMKQAGGMLMVRYEVGFWLTLVFFVTAMVVGTYLYIQERTRVGGYKKSHHLNAEAQRERQHYTS